MSANIVTLVAAVIAALASVWNATRSERRYLRERREEAYVQLLAAASEHQRQVEQALADGVMAPQPSGQYDTAFALAMIRRTPHTEQAIRDLGNALAAYRGAARAVVAHQGDTHPRTEEMAVRRDEARASSRERVLETWTALVDAARRDTAGLSARIPVMRIRCQEP